MAYMHRWWEEVDENLKDATKALVKSGQFQLKLSSTITPFISSLIINDTQFGWMVHERYEKMIT